MQALSESQVTQPSVFEFFQRFPDNDSAHDYFVNARRPDGVICAHCGHDECWFIKTRKRFTCRGCRKQFSVRVGTVMENSPISYQKWLYGMYLFCVFPKGIASTNMAKMVGITQKSAWHMDHRIRTAFEHNGVMLDGVVEVDETYIGGKDRNRPKHKRGGKRGPKGKAGVLGMRERGGRTITRRMDGRPLASHVRSHVAEGAKVYTDEHMGYVALRSTHRHSAVKHSRDEYVRGDVHTNGIESTWALLKRAYMGVYHHWNAEKHGHRYAAEIAGKQSMRGLAAFDDSDGSGPTMIRLLVAGIVGKSLTYEALTQ